MKARIIAVVLVFVLVGCASQAEPTPEPSETSPPPTPTFTPIPPTATLTPTLIPTPLVMPDPYALTTNEDGWQNYVNHPTRLSLLLPPDWAVIDLSSDDFEETIATLRQLSPQLEALFTAEYLNNLALSGVVMMSIETEEEALVSGSMMNLNLIVGVLPAEMTMTDYLELFGLQLRGYYGEELVITQEDTQVGGMEGVKASYEIQTEDFNGETQEVVNQQYMLMKGQTLYVFTFSSIAARTTELDPLIETILNSFEMTVLYASPNATNPYCDSWENACDLQTAMLSARSGEEIWVQAGIYMPAADASAPGASFWLRSGVAVYGGFSGTETSREQRDWENNVTVLSGDLGGDDITDDDGVVTDTDDIMGVNSYHVVNASGTDATAVLDGFVITAGFASETPPNIDGFGGGMVMQSGSPTLTNIVFSANTAGKGAAYYGGGGMYISFSSNPTLTHVSFIANTAGGGAGMYVDRGSNPVLTDVIFTGNAAISASCMGNYAGSSPVLTDVVFDDNSASNKGCMANEENSNPVLTNVTFSNNTGMHGAAMYNYRSSPVLTYVLFIDNYSGAVAGGMKNEGNSNPILTNVLFSGNAASGEGGGMANMDHSSPVLTNVSFINNTAYTASGGGMSSSGGSSPTLTNVTFSGNFAVNGAGLSMWQGVLTMTNVTIIDNTADRDAAAMYNVDCTVNITNSIIWDNSPIDTQILNDRARVEISYSIVAGISTGSGNINRYPMLGELTQEGDYILFLPLLPGSPAIDVGNPSICPATDQRDMPRPVDGDGDGTAICDIGAYEYQGEE